MRLKKLMISKGGSYPGFVYRQLFGRTDYASGPFILSFSDLSDNATPVDSETYIYRAADN